MDKRHINYIIVHLLTNNINKESNKHKIDFDVPVSPNK